MIKKILKKKCLSDTDDQRDDLNYWLGRPPSERVATVDYLRKQAYGTTERLQRSVRIIQQKQS